MGMGPETWMASKRALAYHRACTACVYAQGFLSLARFARGDLVGGLYDALMCGTGAAAIEPGGTRMMPSYVMICGFNGVLGIVQIAQRFQGVSLHVLPFVLVLPPVVATAAAYFGWQFC